MERIVFGPDDRHATGLADPASFVHVRVGFSDLEIRQIMRESARRLAHASA